MPSISLLVCGMICSSMIKMPPACLLEQSGRVTSTKEVIGKKKVVVIEENSVAFKQAGEAGFFHHPSGKNAFYSAFHYIDTNLAPLDSLVNSTLAKPGAIDLTAVTIDTFH